MIIEDLKIKLEDAVLPKRYIHSINVMKTAVELAKKYKEDTEKAAIAGLLHDCARDIDIQEIFGLCEKYKIEIDLVTRAQPVLLHGPVGAELARDLYDIKDPDILNAIRHHTLARENMSMLEKIVFIADYIEPGRNFPSLNTARELAFSNINKAMLFALEGTLRFVMERGILVHVDTIKARNHIIAIDFNNQRVDMFPNDFNRVRRAR